MPEILGIEPDQTPEPLSPDVARDLQADAKKVALHDAWLNSLMTLGFAALTLITTWFDYVRPSRPISAVDSRLAFKFGFFTLLSVIAAFSAWLAFRRMRAAETADSTGAVDPMPYPKRHWISRRARPLILLLLLMAVGYEWYLTRPVATGPIVFRNATISTSTGSLQQNMTVAVADGHIAFVGTADESVPSSLSGARRIDALQAQISAATFDHSALTPLAGLRHVWVGQIYAGAPGDLVVTPVPQGRRRGGAGPGPSPREILGAVVNGRYYAASNLLRK